MQEPFVLSVEGINISGVIHFPRQSSPAFVITCHGLFSSKQSDKFIAIAEHFSNAGLAVVRFDFSGCGESSGNIEDTTVSKRLKQLEDIVRFSQDHPGLGTVFGILGSSLGGYLALLYASKKPVNALSVWAAPYDLKETAENIPEEDLAVLKEEFFVDAEKYSLSSILSKINTLQVIQGKKDDVVPWNHAKKIFSLAKNPKELKIFPGADHTIKDVYDRNMAIRLSLSWFNKHFS